MGEMLFIVKSNRTVQNILMAHSFCLINFMENI